MIFDQLSDIFFKYLPVLLTIVIFGTLYYLVKFIFSKRTEAGKGQSLVQQALLFLIINIGLVALILNFPFKEETTKNHIITLLGYVISAVIALSSATIVGNVLAGVLLRIIRNFKVGQFIKVQDHFGKVTERGLFHTEIQMLNSDLMTLPNLFLVTNPVQVTRETGTFVSSTVSLGYDVPQSLIKKTLLEAAKETNLDNAYVYIEQLGDYSVVYKVQGRLNEVGKIISTTSDLNSMVLKHLHAAKIEIVSPVFMNQRQVDDTVFIPKNVAVSKEPLEYTAIPELLVFEKAEEASSLEEKKKKVEEIKTTCSNLKKNLKSESEAEKKEELSNLLQRWEKRLAYLEKKIEDESLNLSKDS